MTYPFFAATLPALRFEAAPPMPWAEFRRLCGEYLADADMRALAALHDGGDTRNGFVLAWRNRDAQLRNAIARHRAMRLGNGAEAAKWLHAHTGYDVMTENAVAAAFQEADPMKRENALDRIRWTIAEELGGFDPFSAEAIFAYSIKLGILDRRASADAEKGGARLRKTMIVEDRDANGI